MFQGQISELSATIASHGNGDIECYVGKGLMILKRRVGMCNFNVDNLDAVETREAIGRFRESICS